MDQTQFPKSELIAFLKRKLASVKVAVMHILNFDSNEFS